MAHPIFTATATAILVAAGWNGALAQTDDANTDAAAVTENTDDRKPGESPPEYTIPEGGTVEVEVDRDAIATAAAGTRWNDLSDDMENALAARLVNSPFMTENPNTAIRIDIDELSLASTLQAAAGVTDTALEGTVNVMHPTNNTVFDTYDLSVRFGEADPSYAPEGTDMATVTAGSDAHYLTLVNSFADRVVERLDRP